MTEEGRRMLRIRLLHILKKEDYSPLEIRARYKRVYCETFFGKDRSREFWSAIKDLLKGGDIVLVVRREGVVKKVYAITHQGYNKITPRKHRKEFEKKRAHLPMRGIFTKLFR